MHDATVGNLRLYTGSPPQPTTELGDAPHPPDPHELANRELIRPHTYRMPHRGPEPFTADWYEEIAQRRYARHGAWLPASLEFGRHPGESVLLLHPGLGTDAAQYARHGTDVTAVTAPGEHPDLLRTNLARQALPARLVPWDGRNLPFVEGSFDVVVWNALHSRVADLPAAIEQVFRCLKLGGKVIALFPARFDAGYWQDLVLPLQYLYWRRPPDPTSTSKTTCRELRQRFAAFEEHRLTKRHLRRSELPHLWRLLPLAVLERVIGRVLILKAFKPLSAHRNAAIPSAMAA